MENLGPPLLELKDPRAIAYSWGKMHVGGARSTPVRPDESTMGAAILSSPTDEDASLVETRR